MYACMSVCLYVWMYVCMYILYFVWGQYLATCYSLFSSIHDSRMDCGSHVGSHEGRVDCGSRVKPHQWKKDAATGAGWNVLFLFLTYAGSWSFDCCGNLFESPLFWSGTWIFHLVGTSIPGEATFQVYTAAVPERNCATPEAMQLHQESWHKFVCVCVRCHRTSEVFLNSAGQAKFKPQAETNLIPNH